MKASRSTNSIQTMDDPMVGQRLEVLEQAMEANQRGDRRQAYELSLQATEISPKNIQAWILRARTSLSLEEKIVCLNRINSLDPRNPYARLETYAALKNLLEKDPFLAYLDEDDYVYHVHNGVNMLLTVPKDREVPEPIPNQRPQPLKRSSRMLWLGMVGLLASGIGTLIFAPFAIMNALRVDYGSLSRKERMRGNVIIALSILLCLLAIPLVGILLLHIF